MNKWFWRCAVLGNWLVAALWLACWWSRSAGWALVGAAVIACTAGLQLGMQMLLMRYVLRSRRLPRPGRGVALMAWLAEWKLALQVFGWRIPFRPLAESDGLEAGSRGQVGVVLVHGYFCNRAVWNPWLTKLKALGIPCAAMTLEPAHGHPIDSMVADLDASVKSMVQATGCAPLLVAHSMGGLVVRAWLKTLTAEQRAQYVAHVVTVATPHGGTWLARFAHRLPAVDMREGCAWLQQLGWPPDDVLFSCWCSSSDNIVFPPDLAMLPGAQLHQVQDAAHMQLLFDERVWVHCLQLHEQLQSSRWALA